jgi:hypothetical protein
MTKELDPLDEAYVRLGVHEFLLEVITAELLAGVSLNHSTAFKERVREIGRDAYGPTTSDPAKIAKMQATRGVRFVEMLDRLIVKIAERERDLRAGQSQTPSL